MSAEVDAETVFARSSSGRMITKLPTALIARTNSAIAGMARDGSAMFCGHLALIRARLSIAAIAKIGAGSMLYCMWNVQKLGQSFQNRSRK